MRNSANSTALIILGIGYVIVGVIRLFETDKWLVFIPYIFGALVTLLLAYFKRRSEKREQYVGEDSGSINKTEK